VATREARTEVTDARAARYHRIQLTLRVVGFGLGVGYLALVLAAGAGHGLAQRLGAWPWWIQVAGVAAVLAVGHRLLLAPLTWVRGWRLPRRYGLLHQPIGAWLIDQGKAGVLGAVLGLAAITLIYGLLRALPSWWWLAASAAFLALYVAMAVVVPVWIVPLFYRMTPLADEALRARLLALAARTGVPAIGVWVVDQSRKSRAANAAVVGLGHTRRILLFDTILDFAPRELEAVLAHELGHHARHDVWRGLCVQIVVTLVGFAVADVVLARGATWLGLNGIADPAGVPWLALVLGAVGLLALPLTNAYSRTLERAADDFALRTTDDVEGFVDAMERLAVRNLAKRRPHWLVEFLLYSHPSIERRVARARAWAQSHPRHQYSAIAADS
jgi:STE24 endopeptidase